jgi:hypothetical protein
VTVPSAALILCACSRSHVTAGVCTARARSQLRQHVVLVGGHATWEPTRTAQLSCSTTPTKTPSRPETVHARICHLQIRAARRLRFYHVQGACTRMACCMYKLQMCAVHDPLECGPVPTCWACCVHTVGIAVPQWANSTGCWQAGMSGATSMVSDAAELTLSPTRPYPILQQSITARMLPQPCGFCCCCCTQQPRL